MSSVSVAEYYYLGALIASLLCTGMFVISWKGHFNIPIAFIFAVIPVVNLGYYFLALAREPREAILAIKLTYMGGTFLLPLISTVIFSLCKLRLEWWGKVAIYLTSLGLYGSALTIGYSDIHYRNLEFSVEGDTVTLVKTYGPMHNVFYAVLILYVVVDIYVVIYSYLKRKDVSKVNLTLVMLVLLFCVGSFFSARIKGVEFETTPGLYVLTQLLFLVIMDRIALYDVDETAYRAYVTSGAIAAVSFDMGMNFLGCNRTAREYFPELAKLWVDKKLPDPSRSKKFSLEDLEAFQKYTDMMKQVRSTGDAYREVVTRGKKHLEFRVEYIHSKHRTRGYQFIISDVTDRVMNQRLIQGQEMQSKMVMALASMVESRDNSTGGHINRTSSGVAILIDVMRGDETLNLSEEFCTAMIKAAPMHDLGKISVPDAILQKPGKFTPEEYEKMKTHPAEGARIVRDALADSDDRYFAQIAENVAHFHHERWDGKGYPEGLQGEEIPLEGRIMAIADVYDALVSARCYKPKFSPERAYEIIEEGMGSQFDPGLKPFFEKARPALEAYYGSLKESEDLYRETEVEG